MAVGTVLVTDLTRRVGVRGSTAVTMRVLLTESVVRDVVEVDDEALLRVEGVEGADGTRLLFLGVVGGVRTDS